MNNKNINVTIKIIFFILILFFFYCIIYFIPIQTNDELWNYQNVFKISNNNKLYNDANVIITPIFFYIGKILFKFIGNKVISFRIYNILLLCLFYILNFRVFRGLKISNKLSLLYTSIIFSRTVSIFLSSANYNILAICFVLIGIIIYLKYYNKKYYNLLQGIIYFFIFFTKQNTGIYYILALTTYELIDNKLTKKFFISQIKKIIPFILLSILTIFHLYLYGTVNQFLNLCFRRII